MHQEGAHYQAHDDWNRALIALGYDKLEAFNQTQNKMRRFVKKHAPITARIWGAASLEHLTAALAYLFTYQRPDLMEQAEDPFKVVFLYHALEELEHKAVCYDLSLLFSKNYLLRVSTLINGALYLMFIVRRRHIYLLQQDGLWNWPNRLKAWRLIWGRRGLVPSSLVYFFRFFKPGFHPWDHDERADFHTRYQAVLGHLESTGEELSKPKLQSV